MANSVCLNYNNEKGIAENQSEKHKKKHLFSELQIFKVSQPKDRLVHYIRLYVHAIHFYKFFLTFAF